MGGIREVIEKLQLKTYADPQIYDYVLGSVMDVVEIAQEKVIKMKE